MALFLQNCNRCQEVNEQTVIRTNELKIRLWKLAIANQKKPTKTTELYRLLQFLELERIIFYPAP